MSVDNLRETFHINTIGTDALDDFLTAQTYRKDITKAYEIVKSLNWEYLQDLSASRISQGPTPVYGKVGVGCLKSKHTSDLITDIPNNEQDLVDEVWAHEKDAFKVQIGDLVITRKGSGTIGRVSVFFEKTRRNTDDSLFKVTVNKADPCYVASFLSSFTGERLLEKGVYGSTGQLSLSSMHIRKLPIYTPDLVAQTYVGNKLRQAELLREWAKSLEVRFTGELNSEHLEAFENRNSRKKYARAKSGEVSYTLNPGAFNEERLRVQRFLLSNNGVRVSSVASITGGTTSSFSGSTPYIGLDSISENSSKLSPSTVESSDITGSSRVLVEGPVIAKLRPYLNKVSYIPEWLSGSVGSTELLCVKPKGDISSWYLYGILKAEITLKQLRPLATGATLPRIDKYDIYDLVIPILPSQNELGKLLKKAQKAYFESDRLTQAAKNLVEALIEGKITEAELIAAQQALENGDNSKDRAILSKLTDKGYLAEGDKALFPDLDKLYELLDEAHQARYSEAEQGASA
jgi:type I restriction enzyme S subunit